MTNGSTLQPSPQPTWLKALKLAVSLLFLLGFLALPMVWFYHASPSERWGAGLTIIILAALGILSANYPRIEQGINHAFALSIAFCLWLIAALLPMAVFRWVAEFTLSSLPQWLQALTLLAWGMLLALGLWIMATERGRRQLFDRLSRIGILAPVLYAINVLVIANIFFATLSYLLYQRAWLTYNAEPESEVALWSLMDFYLWHFLDAIPTLKIPQTLRWSQPLDYDSAATGWMLLLFKLTVIVPTIGVFVGYWRRHTAAKE